MSEQVSAPAESAKPENLSLDERVAQALANRTDAQDHVEEVVAEPDATQVVAPETPAEPETPQPGAWRKVILDDVDHGFFKGKPAEQLYNSYRESESAKQKAERERNEARAELDRLRREREADDAVRRVLPQPAAAEATQKEDPRDAEIERNWFENPAEAKRLLREQLRDENKQVSAQEFERLYSEKRATEEITHRQKAANQAASIAAQRVMTEFGLSEEDAAKAVTATFVYVNNHAVEDPNVWTNPEAYIYYAKEMRRVFGGNQPAQETVQPPAPPANIPMPPSQPKQPPGATKPAPVAAPPEIKPSALSPENRRVREMLGGPSLVARGERRKRA